MSLEACKKRGSSGAAEILRRTVPELRDHAVSLGASRGQVGAMKREDLCRWIIARMQSGDGNPDRHVAAPPTAPPPRVAAPPPHPRAVAVAAAADAAAAAADRVRINPFSQVGPPHARADGRVVARPEPLTVEYARTHCVQETMNLLWATPGVKEAVARSGDLPEGTMSPEILVEYMLKETPRDIQSSNENFIALYGAIIKYAVRPYVRRESENIFEKRVMEITLIIKSDIDAMSARQLKQDYVPAERRRQPPSHMQEVAEVMSQLSIAMDGDEKTVKAVQDIVEDIVTDGRSLALQGDEKVTRMRAKVMDFLETGDGDNDREMLSYILFSTRPRWRRVGSTDSRAGSGALRKAIKARLMVLAVIRAFYHLECENKHTIMGDSISDLDKSRLFNVGGCCYYLPDIVEFLKDARDPLHAPSWCDVNKRMFEARRDVKRLVNALKKQTPMTDDIKLALSRIDELDASQKILLAEERVDALSAEHPGVPRDAWQKIADVGRVALGLDTKGFRRWILREREAKRLSESEASDVTKKIDELEKNITQVINAKGNYERFEPPYVLMRKLPRVYELQLQFRQDVIFNAFTNLYLENLTPEERRAIYAVRIGEGPQGSTLEDMLFACQTLGPDNLPRMCIMIFGDRVCKFAFPLCFLDDPLFFGADDDQWYDDLLIKAEND